jgi:hypothetical protein
MADFPMELRLSSTNVDEPYRCPCGHFELNLNFDESSAHLQGHGYIAQAIDPNTPAPVFPQADGTVLNPGIVVFRRS